MWRRVLALYIKALYYKENLLKDLTVGFLTGENLFLFKMASYVIGKFIVKSLI